MNISLKKYYKNFPFGDKKFCTLVIKFKDFDRFKVCCSNHVSFKFKVVD